MQTLCTGCSKAEPKIFAPSQTPFLGARDGQNLISWRWANPVWWGSMYALLSYRGNRPKNTPTNRTDYNTLCNDMMTMSFSTMHFPFTRLEVFICNVSLFSGTLKQFWQMNFLSRHQSWAVQVTVHRFKYRATAALCDISRGSINNTALGLTL